MRPQTSRQRVSSVKKTREIKEYLISFFWLLRGGRSEMFYRRVAEHHRVVISILRRGRSRKKGEKLYMRNARLFECISMEPRRQCEHACCFGDFSSPLRNICPLILLTLEKLCSRDNKGGRSTNAP